VVSVAAAEGVEAVVEGDADEDLPKPTMGRWGMRFASKTETSTRNFCLFAVLICACPYASLIAQTGQSEPTKSVSSGAAGMQGAEPFNSPEQAADTLIEAASKSDTKAMQKIFGLQGYRLISTGEEGQDREHAAEFVAQAKERKTVSIDPKSRNRAFLVVGNEGWPFPVPIVKRNGKWSFDAAAGRQELLYRRIGANELDAIQICEGYVEAQYDYAYRKREGYAINQYAQRIISTEGKQDGLAWQNPDGSWSGPIGEKIAQAIQQGYTNRVEPYHGYFFKILKGQGPAAPLGQMDYVVEGAMIGGFALVAAPAEYAVTGVKTFMVSQDGVVYQKDLGPRTLAEFKSMNRFNPDKTWNPVPEKDEQEARGTN